MPVRRRGDRVSGQASWRALLTRAGAPCTPDSDANIFNSADPTSPRYVGLHPGTAFMEVQFYPPGCVKKPFGDSCAATRWCAALTIDITVHHFAP